MHDHARSRPSAHLPVPPEVHDVLLWRLAIDVAWAHRPGHNGRCASLLCANQHSYPCPPRTAAHQAARAANRQPHPLPTSTMQGRAAVPFDSRTPPAGATPSSPPTHLSVQRSGHPLWPPPLRRPAAYHAAA